MEEDSLKELGEHIAHSLEQEVSSYDVKHGELTVIARADTIVPVLTFLRDDPSCHFSVLIDLCGADYPEHAQRFEVVYHLLSMHRSGRTIHQDHEGRGNAQDSGSAAPSGLS